MPIPVTCGSCSARLNAPDAAAGKAVRCPKCQKPVPVPKPAADPGFEVVDDAPVPPPAVKKSGPLPVPAVKKSGPVPVRPAVGDSGERPAARKPARDEDEVERPSERKSPRDEDDADDDRPARGRSRSRDDEDDDRPHRRGSPAGKNLKQRGLIAGVVGGVLSLAVIVTGMMSMASLADSIADRNQFGGMGNNGEPFAFGGGGGGGKPAGTPAGWEKFKDPLNEIDLYFPFAQPEKNEPLSRELSTAIGGPADIWTHAANFKTYLLKRVTLTPKELADNPPDKLIAISVAAEREAWPGAQQRDVTTFDNNGERGALATIDLPTDKKRLFVRVVLAKNRIVTTEVIGPPTMSATDADVRPFLDNLKVPNPITATATAARPSGAAAGPAGLPSGWVKFNDPQNEVVLYAPGQLTKNTFPTDKTREEWVLLKDRKLFALVRSTAKATGDKPEKVLFDSMNDYLKASNGGKPAAATYEPPVFDKSGRVSRVAVWELKSKSSKVFFRGVVSGNRVLIASYTTGSAAKRDDPDVKAFLDSFESLK